MKNYKEYDKIYIGYSDISTLVTVGITDAGLTSHFINFAIDSEYEAYCVDEEAEIGDHYELVSTWEQWLKIYDDEQCTQEFLADKIHIYRAGAQGCIIQVVNGRRVRYA